MMKSKEVQDYLTNDIKASAELNINAIPTIFIKGRRLKGLPNGEFLEVIISDELEH